VVGEVNFTVNIYILFNTNTVFEQTLADFWDVEIHRAFAHPIRRCIINRLQEKQVLTFEDLRKYCITKDHGKLGFHLRLMRGLVEHYSSAKGYSLTDRGLLAGKILLNIKEEIEKTQEEWLTPVRFVQRLKFGDHVTLFYDEEQVRDEIVYQYLKRGLLNGEASLYLVPEHRVDNEKRKIEKYGINNDNFPEETVTLMSAEEWYLRKGKAQAKTIINNWRELLKEKQKAGYTGVRGVGEMEPFFDYSRKILFKYEKELGRQFKTNLSAICCYNGSKLNADEFLELISHHGNSIVDLKHLT
jgi:hypothetical protein